MAGCIPAAPYLTFEMAYFSVLCRLYCYHPPSASAKWDCPKAQNVTQMCGPCLVCDRANRSCSKLEAFYECEWRRQNVPKGGGVSFALRFRVLALPLSRSRLRLLAGGEPRAFAVDLPAWDL